MMEFVGIQYALALIFTPVKDVLLVLHDIFQIGNVLLSEVITMIIRLLGSKIRTSENWGVGQLTKDMTYHKLSYGASP